jgi:hypothetical protein
MRYLIAFVVVLGACTATADVLGMRTDWGYDGDGNYTLVTERQLFPGPVFTEADYLPPQPDCELMWRFNTPEHWVYTTAIGNNEQNVFVGGWTGYEDYLGFSMFEMEGDGEPVWQYWNGFEEYGVGAARGADVFYGIHEGHRLQDAAFEVYKFHSGSPEPDWVYDLIAHGYWPCAFLSDPGVLSCSDDGSVMSLKVSNGKSPVILFFHPDSPEPFEVLEFVGVQLAPYRSGPWRTYLNPDGSTCLFRLAGAICRYNLESGALELNWPPPVSHWLRTYGPDLSVMVQDRGPQGPFSVFQWNGEEYVELWSYDLPGANHPKECAISRDNQRLVVAWAYQYDRIDITGFDVFSETHPTPAWTYTIEVVGGDYFFPTYVDISDDGEWAAVGITGTDDDGPPETWIFKFSEPEEPAYLIDNRGLVMMVDVAPEGDYVLSVSKSVNYGWSWGDSDVYAARLEPSEDLVPVAFTADSAEDGVLVRWEVEEGRGVRLRRVSGDAVGSASLTEELLPLSGTYLDRDAEAGRTYEYYLRVYADDALFREFGPVEVERTPSAGELALLAPYPSPVTSASTLCYNLPSDGRATLTVYDLAGRRVDTLVDSEMTSGRHEVTWDASALSAGVYLVLLDTDSGRAHRRLVVAR